MIRQKFSCPGKINLFLKVTGRRPDGYHELDTLFVPLKCPADELEFSPSAAPGQITFNCPAFPGAGQDNLVVKAAQRFAEVSGIGACWDFVLHKKIPVAAGLGGGSSDAAAALAALNGYYGVFTPVELREIAVKIGADVPFFLDALPARAQGVGEKLETLPELKDFPEVMIVFPGFPVSAKWAYQHLAPEHIGAVPAQKSEILAKVASGNGGMDDYVALVHNDLAFALYEKFPLLGMLKEFIMANGAMAVEVSGSGSSLFALFEKGSAVKCAGALRGSYFNNPMLRIFASGSEL